MTGCGAIPGRRGSYIDFLRVDQRPSLVGEGVEPDSLFEQREKGEEIAESKRDELEALILRFTPSLILPRADYTTKNGRKYRILPSDVRLFRRYSRGPRYVHDSRGSSAQKDLERLGLVPQDGGKEIGFGTTILGASIAFPQYAFSDVCNTSVGLFLIRNVRAKVHFGAFEFMGGYQKFSRRGPDNGSLFIYPFTANLVLRMPDIAFRSYVSAGGGPYGWESRVSVSPGGDQLVASGWSFGWTIAVGVEYYLRPWAALDLAFRYHWTGIDNAKTGVEDDSLQFIHLWIGHYVRFLNVCEPYEVRACITRQ